LLANQGERRKCGRNSSRFGGTSARWLKARGIFSRHVRHVTGVLRPDEVRHELPFRPQPPREHPPAGPPSIRPPHPRVPEVAPTAGTKRARVARPSAPPWPFPGGVRNARRRKRRSRPVSRVLYALRRDSHSSRPGVTAWLQRPTREQRGPRYRSPIRSCSGWGLPCRATLSPHAVRSYRTLSPLPDPLARPSAVCSLLHWPSARAAQALPGTLPCGARTFLDALAVRRDCPADSASHCNGPGQGLGIGKDRRGRVASAYRSRCATVA
jgi:hypothetical protein